MPGRDEEPKPTTFIRLENREVPELKQGPPATTFIHTGPAHVPPVATPPGPVKFTPRAPRRGLRPDPNRPFHSFVVGATTGFRRRRGNTRKLWALVAVLGIAGIALSLVVIVMIAFW